MSTSSYDIQRQRRYVPPPRKIRVDDINVTDGLTDDGMTYEQKFGPTPPGAQPSLIEPQAPAAPPVIQSPSGGVILQPPVPQMGNASPPTAQPQYDIQPPVSPDIAGAPVPAQDPTTYIQPQSQAPPGYQQGGEWSKDGKAYIEPAPPGQPNAQRRIYDAQSQDPHAVSARSQDGTGYAIEPSTRARRVEGQPTGNPNPTTSGERLGMKEDELADRQVAPYRKESRLKSALKMLAYGVGKSFERHGAARNWGEFWNQTAEGVGSSVAGLLDPTLHDKLVDRPYELERLGGSVKTMRESENRKEISAGRESVEENRKFNQRYKLEAQRISEKYKTWQMKTGDEKWTKKQRDDAFWQDLAEDKFISEEAKQKWREEKTVRDEQFRADRFEERKRATKARENAAKRTAERLEKKAASGPGGQVAGREAAAKFYASEAKDYESQAQEAEDNGDLDEALELHKMANSMRRSEATARAGAIQRGATAPPSGIMTQEEAQQYADSPHTPPWDAAKKARYMAEWARKASMPNIGQGKPAAEGRK